MLWRRQGLLSIYTLNDLLLNNSWLTFERSRIVVGPGVGSHWQLSVLRLRHTWREMGDTSFRNQTKSSIDKQGQNLNVRIYVSCRRSCWGSILPQKMTKASQSTCSKSSIYTPCFLLTLLIHPSLHMILPFLDFLPLFLHVRRSHSCRLWCLALGLLENA